jgi:hypothetical protein
LVYWSLIWFSERFLNVFVLCRNTLVFQTWYQNLYEDPLLLLIEILNLCRFMHQNIFKFFYFLCISRLINLFHCACSATFNWKNFSFHPKMNFLFSQDMTIFVRSRGIKFQHAFYYVNISFFCFVYILGLVLFLVYICSLSCTLCNINK